MRHGKSHFVVFLALNSPGPYHRYFKLWQREPGFLSRLGQFSRPLQPMASANVEFETPLNSPPFRFSKRKCIVHFPYELDQAH